MLKFALASKCEQTLTKNLLVVLIQYFVIKHLLLYNCVS